MRSFTWQLRHQLAVKSTKTGCPAASERVTASGDQGCQRPRNSGGDKVSDAVISFCGAKTSRATTPTKITAATMVDQRLAGHRPINQPATASKRKLPNKEAS